MKFVVTIEETGSQDFVIEAENSEEALEIIREKYKTCECVLEAGNLIGIKILIRNEFEEDSDWIDFK